ncbi:hypothetical protein JCM19297_3186 [Nonlabens ulvanivorans]|nr:hypothetical protein JCM19297_3186 [Nonlabens ulvanivorans]
MFYDAFAKAYFIKIIFSTGIFFLFHVISFLCEEPFKIL